MKRVAITGFGAVLGALALAGCGEKAPQDVSLTNVTSAEVGAALKAAGRDTLQNPGLWRNKAEVVSIDLPGVPAGPEREQTLALLRAQIAGEREVCVTPEKARAAAAQAFGTTQNCKFAKYELKNGRIDAQATCETPGGAVNNAVTGKAEPGAIDLTSSVHTADRTGPNAADIVLHITGTRTGDCKS